MKVDYAFLWKMYFLSNVSVPPPLPTEFLIPELRFFFISDLMKVITEVTVKYKTLDAFFILRIFQRYFGISLLIISPCAKTLWFQGFRWRNTQRPLRKITWFHQSSWCGKFAEKLSFRIVSGESSKTQRKLCLSANFLP